MRDLFLFLAEMIGHLYEGKDIEGRLPKHFTASGTDTATGANTTTGTNTGAERCKPSESDEDDVCSVAAERQMGGCESAKRTLSKTDLLLSVQQMMEESYPLPFDKDDGQLKSHDPSHDSVWLR